MNRRLLRMLSFCALTILLVGCARASFVIRAELPLSLSSSENVPKSVETFTSYMEGFDYSCQFTNSTPPAWECSGKSTKTGFPVVNLLMYDDGLVIHFHRTFTKWAYIDDTPPAPSFLEDEYSELIPLLREFGVTTVNINSHDGRIYDFPFDNIDWLVFEN